MQLKNSIKIKKMDRRLAIKNLALGLGYTVATPTLFSLLSSCNEKVETWKPNYFTESQKHMITYLVDIILPASETPGGLDVNVPQFMDLMYNEYEKEESKSLFQRGALEFQKRFETSFTKDVLKGKKIEFEELFKSVFTLSEADTKKVLKNQKLRESTIEDGKKADYYMYKFLFSVRNYSLFGYFTSEKVGEEVLSYDPVPGEYKGCIPIEEVGNAWSLK